MPKIIECFIPANSLQNYANGESFTLNEKLCAAIRRFEQNGSFNDRVIVKYPMSYIQIKSKKLNISELGYNIVAKIM